MPDASKEVVAKAYTIGRDPDELDIISKAEQASTDASGVLQFGSFTVDSLPAPYDPLFLCKLYEHANSLRQNVDAYKTNIDGFGHVFEPIIELRESGAREMVADAIYLEREERVRTGTENSLDGMTAPTPEEIDKKIEELRYRMRIEKARVESFFDNCVAEESFISLRRKTREDVEVTGNGYWEVIRNSAGMISQFVHMPSRSVRVAKDKSKLVAVSQHVRIGTLAYRTEVYKRRFRRYVQIGGDKPVFFKEYGDTTIVSQTSGKEYESGAKLMAEEGMDAREANEVFHFKVHSVRNSAYGVPRWIGNLLSVLGSRSAEEVNLAYFDNKSIPPMAILVSGGRLGDDSVKRIQDFVEINIKGKKNFHKILVIEAETSAGAIGLQDNAASMRVEIKQLTDAQLKDGLFRDYDAANMDKVGMGFRLPRLLRGDIRDFNRASAQSALDFAESQVFVPERNDFDFAMNRFVLTALGIKLWRFKSLGPRLSDSQEWGDMIVKLTTAGILTPQDAREISGKKVLSHELPSVNADWVKQPLALTIANVPLDTTLDNIIPTSEAGREPSVRNPNPQVMPEKSLLAAAKGRLMRKAKQLLDLRDEFREQEAVEAVERYKEERIEEGELVFQMTPEEMEERFGIKKT